MISIISIGQGNEMKGLLEKANKYRSTNHLLKCIELSDSIIKLATTQNNDSVRFTAHYYKISCYNRLEYYERALDEIRNILPEVEAGNNKVIKGRVWRAIGGISLNLDDNENSVLYYKKAIEIFRDIKDTIRIAAVLNDLGLLYLMKKNTEEAIQYFTESAKLYRSVWGNHGDAIPKGNLGDAYMIMGKYDQAILLFEEAVSKTPKHKEIRQLSFFNSMVNTYIHQKNFDKADSLCNYTREKAIELHSEEDLRETYRLGAKIAFIKGNYKKAYELRLLKDSLLDLSQERNKNANVTKMNALLELEKKEFLLKSKEAEKQLLQYRFMTTMAVAITVLLIVLIILNRILRHRKRILKERSLLKEEKKNLREELINYALFISNRDQVIDDVRKGLNKLSRGTSGSGIDEINNLVMKLRSVSDGVEEDIVTSRIDVINKGFINSLKKAFPDLTKNDLELCVLLRLNLSTKDIAVLLSKSSRAVEVSRYRLRKKINLNKEDNLVDILSKY